MKKTTTTILASILLLTAGCGGGKQSTDELITVDVTKKYPKKELILQDFMDVEYIPLETNDEFVLQGFVLFVGGKFIGVRNYTNDGNIFLFDRKTGNALKRINRRGEGGEEYTTIQRVVLGEDNEEIFVNDHFTQKVVVYDLDGNFIRCLKQNNHFDFAHMCNFDSDNLICNNWWVTNRQPFTIISKQDGCTTKEIQIPFVEKIQISLSFKDEVSGMTYGAAARSYNPIIPNHDDWVIVEPSSDTIYRYQPDHTMIPFIVRTPTIQSMKPEVFLFFTAFSDRYYFLETVKKEFDFATSTGFPGTDLMYDKKEKAIFNYVVYNDDYSVKRTVNMKSTPISNEIVSWQFLDASQLVKDYEKGILNGQLKKIAATLDEESNPVLMLIKHKK